MVRSARFATTPPTFSPGWGTEMSATTELGEMFARKYAEATANGATDEQAIEACRALWLEAISEDGE